MIFIHKELKKSRQISPKAGIEMNEATARIKINRLLEAAGWRFFGDDDGPANIRLERQIALKPADIDRLGDDFENAGKGFVDFLLLDENGFPLVVLEAKSEGKEPLVGKEQARSYARSLNCRFVILSNGNLHYFWDLERGNPHIITQFPTPDSVNGYKRTTPNPRRLVDEEVNDDYIALTQRPGYRREAAYINEAERPDFIQSHGLRFLRDYQLRAVHSLQRAVKEGSDRFLFEMATGTGKTLVSAAIIKLFLRTGNARRVLFLVDRLELENQAHKVFRELLSNDFDTVIYKERRDDWRRAHIVVTTVQSLLFNNKYQSLFSPTDFDLVISDEAHRSISGNARAVFEYFVGYKLGLTATPRDYFRGVSSDGMSPIETERRLILDTYRTFGCETREPTYRYSLPDGVKDGHLINPLVVDARTETTTQLLSEQGFTVIFTDEDSGEAQIGTFEHRDFEQRFFAASTNRLFCQTFLANAMRDPITNEIGKSVIFAVSQNHAARLTNILNDIADEMFPGKYQSDFAVQVTSHVPDAQQYAISFANNNLMGRGNAMPEYRTSKARVCVTVGMMTTGYDCPDLLNLGLFRPIFSPTEFIQIKGRGTRKHDFLDLLLDEQAKEDIGEAQKMSYKLFDFFANCEYFETEFDYDEKLELPKIPSRDSGGAGDDDGTDSPYLYAGAYTHLGGDELATIREEQIGYEGMRIDRMYFDRFADSIRNDDFISTAVEEGEWDKVIEYVNREVLNKPEDYYTLPRLRRAADVDRRISIREILERALELIPRFKSKDELLEEEFAKFIADHPPQSAESILTLRAFFKAYAANEEVRRIIDGKQFADLATNPFFSLADFIMVPEEYRTAVPEYIKDYVSFNQFAA